MKCFFTLLICGTFSLCSMAQVPQLLKDVNPNTTDAASGSFPKKGITVNGRYYFPASNHQGVELWSTDGTGAGTRIVRDVASISPYDNANPRHLMSFGDTIFFFSSNEINVHRYITSTDRYDHVFSYSGTTPGEAVKAGRYIYFPGDAYYSDGVELLQYDVQSNSLRMFDVDPGPMSSYPQHLTVKGDTVFFVANQGGIGTELFMYNPVMDMIQSLGDIYPGPSSSFPHDLVIYNNKVFFSADDGVHGNELWSADGDPVNTALFADINENNSNLDPGNPIQKTVFNNQLFFRADDGNNGVELWVADDNTQNCEMMYDINMFGDSYPGIYGFRAAGNFLYFAADDGSEGTELWRTDGTNTSLVSNIRMFGASHPLDMYNINDTLIFAADDGAGYELWRTDGVNTVMIKDIQAPFTDTVRISGIFNGKVYFSADNGTTGHELWRTDGTTANTTIVKDIDYGNNVHSTFSTWFEALNGEMYFGAQTSPTYRYGLHKTDGSVGNTTEVKAGGGAEGFSVSHAAARRVGSTLFFTAETDADGLELWKTNGTTGSTLLVKNINTNSGEGSNPRQLVELGGVLLFIAGDGTEPGQLWRSDGTSAGTTVVKTINPAGDPNVHDYQPVNGKLCFIADDGVNGEELWVTDGTTAGTIMLANINGSPAGSSVGNLTAIGSRIYFTADNGVNGTEVWVTDGTPGGTVLFKDINPGPGSSNSSNFAELGGWIYFGATDTDSQPAKLWRTDGTAANTSQFADVNFPFFFKRTGNHITFWAFPSTSNNGFHLWSTDGSVAGTQEIEDFLPGSMAYLLLDDFPVYNGKWFLWLDDRISGQELWAANGMAGGVIKYDIAPGPSSSYPRNAKGLNPLIFTANDGTTVGNEIWRLDVSATLPVTGLEFNVTKASNKARLEWKTLTEENNRGFEIEESADGVRFSNIGFVEARGAGGNGASYDYIDASVIQGKNYYRLVQVDNDGRTKYSAVRWIDFDENGYVKSYPNPAGDLLYINTSYTFRNAIVNIHSMSGQLAKQVRIDGSGTIAIPVNGLPAGVYSAEIVQPGQRVKMAFVKQ